MAINIDEEYRRQGRYIFWQFITYLAAMVIYMAFNVFTGIFWHEHYWQIAVPALIIWLAFCFMSNRHAQIRHAEFKKRVSN